MFLNKLVGAAVIALGLAAASAQAAHVVPVEGLEVDADGHPVIVNLTLTDPNNLPYESFWRSTGTPGMSSEFAVTEGQWVNFSLTTADLGDASLSAANADGISLTFNCATGTCYTATYSSTTYGSDLTSSDPWLSAGGSGVVSYPQSIWLTAFAPVGAISVQAFVKNGDDDSNYAIGSVQVVPEPETYALLMAGLGVMGFLARRRKQQD